MRAPQVRIGGQVYPPTLSTDEAAASLGCGVDALRQRHSKVVRPCEPLRLGNRLRWPTAQVAAALGLPAEIVDRDGSEGVADTLPEPAPALVGAAAAGPRPDARGGQ